jgi:3-methyl-2-oxobutanoate hydroxymethyltransferase
MVDNFMSAGTNGDADDEMPAPYGTGPKNRTTEEHQRSDYGYAEPDSGDGGWRERSTALDGLDPAPSLPNAPRSYERGPVPQQPYVPKPPFLPPSEREYPPAGGYQQQYGEQPAYGESSTPWGESESFREPGYEESPFAPRPSYQERPTQERPTQERPAVDRPAPERPQPQHQERPPQQEQNPFRPQPPQGPPPQAQRQNPFAPGRNGTSGPPPNRPGAPGPTSTSGTAPGVGPGGPAQPGPRPAAPGPSSNGMTPHSSNGRSNGLSAPTPPPSPSGPPASNPAANGVAASNGLGSNGLGSNGLGSNGLGSNGHGSNGLAAGNTPADAPQSNGPAASAPQTGPANAPMASNSGNQGPNNPAPSSQGPSNQVPSNQGPGGNRPTSQGSTGWSAPAPAAGSAPPAPASSASNGYPSDPSAEYESNSPVAASPQSGERRAGARRRADVQQDAPSQVTQEPAVGHRARRAQPAPPTAEAPSSRPVTNSVAGNESASSATGSSGSSSTPADGSKRPRRYRIHHLRDMKNRGEKWAMLTAYDQYTAEIFDHAGIPVLLVGDSAANNVFGYESTLRVTVDELIPLARAVAGAVERAFVVADLPFGSYQASPEQAFHTAVRFMKEAGVHAVKLEGGRTMVPAVEKLTQAGIPVMAHIGFTPQSEHSIGGYRVQGRGDQAAGLIDDAVALAEAGAFSVVLEMVPGDVSAEITKRIPVPTIGIGAGRDTDAQVLVWQDMAGLRSGPMPRFVKQYADLRGILTNAATTYAAEVASGTFPTDEHTF